MNRKNLIISSILVIFSIIIEMIIGYNRELDIYWYGNFMFITLNAVALLLFNLNYILKKVYYIILSLIPVIPIIILIFNLKYIGVYTYPANAIKLISLSILLYIFSPQMIFIYYKNSLYSKIECTDCKTINKRFNNFCCKCGNKVEYKNKIWNYLIIISSAFQITGIFLLLFCNQIFGYIFISVKIYHIFTLLYSLLFSFLFFMKINKLKLNKIVNLIFLLFIIISSVALGFITYNTESFLFTTYTLISLMLLNLFTYCLLPITFNKL